MSSHPSGVDVGLARGRRVKLERFVGRSAGPDELHARPFLPPDHLLAMRTNGFLVQQRQLSKVVEVLYAIGLQIRPGKPLPPERCVLTGQTDDLA